METASFPLSSTQKGDQFENEVFYFLKDLIQSGEYWLDSANCKFYQKKKYYSHKRKGYIEIDISIEVYRNDQPSMFLFVECKNYAKKVSVDDVEEFDSKIGQIAGRNAKGMFFTTVGYQSGALNVAESQGIGLARLLPEENVEWILERSPEAVKKQDRVLALKRETISALTNTDYVSNAEVFFGVCNNIYSTSVVDILRQLIPAEEPIGTHFISSVEREVSPTQRIPYIGMADIEKRVDGILRFFGRKIREEDSIELLPIYEFLKKHKGLHFTFDNDLGENSDGNEILGKYNVAAKELHITNRLEQNSQRWRFTAAHELGHYLYHRNLFKTQRKELHFDTLNTTTWGALKGLPMLRLEWQANAFASALLLPRKMVFSTVLKLLQEYNVSNYGHGLIYLDEQSVNIDTYQKILRAIVRKFNVSYQCAHYRLLQLKILNNNLKMKKLRDINEVIPVLRQKEK